MRALLIGKSSFLARAVIARAATVSDLRAVSHKELPLAGELAGYDVVVNMAYDPAYPKGPYDGAHDFDLRVAQAVASAERPHFVMLSTRRVYGPASEWPLTEGSATNPADHYGRNKLHTEGRVLELLGNRATVLRAANIFGFEPDRHTFFGIALSRLQRQGAIHLDVSPFVARDFLPVENFADAMLRILRSPPSGVYNLGSGLATPLGRIALGIIAGYGRGVLTIDAPDERDGFLLDSSKLDAVIPYLDSGLDIEAHCRKIGEMLLDA